MFIIMFACATCSRSSGCKIFFQNINNLLRRDIESRLNLPLHPPAQVLYTVGVLYKITTKNAIKFGCPETYQQLQKVMGSHRVYCNYMRRQNAFFSMKTSVTIGALVFMIAFSYTFLAMHFVPESKVAFLKENLSSLASQQASVVEASHEQQREEKVPQTVSEVIEVKPESVYVPAKMNWSLASGAAEWKARDSAASFVFNDKMWIMGGLNGNGVRTNTENAVHYWEAKHFNDIWSSEDGVTWNQETAHAEWSQRRSMSVVNFNEKLWMFGGWESNLGYTSDIWSSDDGVHWERAIALAPWRRGKGRPLRSLMERYGS
jgi:hypothetical protein